MEDFDTTQLRCPFKDCESQGVRQTSWGYSSIDVQCSKGHDFAVNGED